MSESKPEGFWRWYRRMWDRTDTALAIALVIMAAAYFLSKH